MSDSIIQRLRNNHLNANIKESLTHSVFEAEDDDLEIDKEDLEAPEDEEVGDEDEVEVASEDENDEEMNSSPNSSSSTSSRGSSHPVDTSPKENPATPVAPKVTAENPNPLDNTYAMNYKMGDKIAMVYSTGAKTALEGTIEGYDKEGFYRVKWKDGRVTNGLTDIAIAELVGESVDESVCVCGCDKFVEEDGKLVCDKCGRIREGADLLADAPKPKKRIIRATPHPISTATRPDISESINKALRDIKSGK